MKGSFSKYLSSAINHLLTVAPEFNTTGMVVWTPFADD
jgi:hypothetical protein